MSYILLGMEEHLMVLSNFDFVTLVVPNINVLH